MAGHSKTHWLFDLAWQDSFASGPPHSILDEAVPSPPKAWVWGLSLPLYGLALAGIFSFSVGIPQSLTKKSIQNRFNCVLLEDLPQKRAAQESRPGEPAPGNRAAGFGGPEPGTLVNLPGVSSMGLLPQAPDLFDTSEDRIQNFALPISFDPGQPLVVGDGQGNKSGLGGKGIGDGEGSGSGTGRRKHGQGGSGSWDKDPYGRPPHDIQVISTYIPNYNMEKGQDVAPGPVRVKLSVDQEGVPISAEPVSGNPVLWPSAKEGALKWRFYIPAHLKTQAPFQIVILFRFTQLRGSQRTS